MVFSSLIFLFRFLPAFWLVYLAVPGRWKNPVLFLGSLFFYAWGEPVYVLLLLVSTASDYCCGRLIGRLRREDRRGAARGTLAVSLAVNLGLLGFFKYAVFLVETVNALAGTRWGTPGLPLPVGISFYTFQTMSYTIDVYRGNVRPQKDPAAFGAFVTMFPQLVAGPIVSYRCVKKELKERKITPEGLGEGWKRFVIGLGKKTLLANQAGALFSLLGARKEAGAAVLWAAVLCFGFQIYFDFSGYSDMASGLGRMMGFSFPENFRYPYTARSVTEFWQRWHMTLSGWFREYVYIPLGGNRKGTLRHAFNLLAVWILTGIWHGAAWNFLLWGLWFFCLLILEKFWLKGLLERLPAPFRRAWTLGAVFAGWALFCGPDLAGLAARADPALQTGARGLAFAASSLAGRFGWGWDDFLMYELISQGALLAALAAGCTPLPAAAGRKIAKGKGGAFWETAFLLGTFLLSVAYLVEDSYNPFLYFRF